MITSIPPISAVLIQRAAPHSSSLLENRTLGRCEGGRQGWDHTGRVGSQYGQVGKSNVVGSGDGKGLEQGVSVSGSQKKKRQLVELLL